MADQLRRGAHQGRVGGALDLHRVVGDEAVAPLDQLDGRLALAHAAFAQQQQSLAVDLHQHAVAGDPGGQLHLQPADAGGHELGGVPVGEQNRGPVLLGHLQALGVGLGLVADHQGRDAGGEHAGKGLPPLVGGQAVQIGGLHHAHHLEPLGHEVVVKAGELEAGAVDVGGLDQHLVIGLGLVEDLQLEMLHHL